MALSMSVTLTRVVKPEEIDDLVFGTGALSMEWWHGAEVGRYDNSLGIKAWVTRGREDTSIYEDDLIRIWHYPKGEETGRAKTELTLQQIVDAVTAAQQYIPDEAKQDMVQDELGLADAIAADIVLQYAVFGELVYG